jgi:hypothetical protein
MLLRAGNPAMLAKKLSVAVIWPSQLAFDVRVGTYLASIPAGSSWRVRVTFLMSFFPRRVPVIHGPLSVTTRI